MATFAEEWIAHTILYDYGFYPLQPTKYEPDNVLFGDRCWLFANVSNRLRVLVKFDPFALEPDDP